MTTEELRNQVQELVGCNMTQEQFSEVESVLSLLESNAPEELLREKISQLTDNTMLKTLCSRF